MIKSDKNYGEKEEKSPKVAEKIEKYKKPENTISTIFPKKLSFNLALCNRKFILFAGQSTVLTS